MFWKSLSPFWNNFVLSWNVEHSTNSRCIKVNNFYFENISIFYFNCRAHACWSTGTGFGSRRELGFLVLLLRLDSRRLGLQSINDVYFVGCNPFKLCSADVSAQIQMRYICVSNELTAPVSRMLRWQGHFRWMSSRSREPTKVAVLRKLVFKRFPMPGSSGFITFSLKSSAFDPSASGPPYFSFLSFTRRMKLTSCFLVRQWDNLSEPLS